MVLRSVKKKITKRNIYQKNYGSIIFQTSIDICVESNFYEEKKLTIR